MISISPGHFPSENCKKFVPGQRRQHVLSMFTYNMVIKEPKILLFPDSLLENVATLLNPVHLKN